MIKKKAGRKSKRPDKTQFEMIYSRQTAQQAADFFGVSPQTIYQWAVQFRKEENRGGYNRKRTRSA